MQYAYHIPKDSTVSNMIERFLKIFMDDFSTSGYSFQQCLHHLKLVLMHCREKQLTFKWKKDHFMVQNGIVLGHVISKNGIEIDKAKVDQSWTFHLCDQWKIYNFSLAILDFIEDSSKSLEKLLEFEHIY